MNSSGRPVDLGDPRTPMAWQHRDLNYHQSGYQDRYGAGAEAGSSRAGPPSTSDRLSHRTDKTWRTHRDSRDSGQPNFVPYGGGYPMGSGPPGNGQYPPSRPSYSSGHGASHLQSSSDTSSSSSSSSDEESENTVTRGPEGPPPNGIYGYGGHYHGYMPGMVPAPLKPARSVPALGTWDGEPCPVHGVGPLSLPGYPPFPHSVMPVPHGPMMPPGPMLPPPGLARRSASIYDMRGTPPSAAAIYGTLPARSLPGIPADKRSLAGSTVVGPMPPGVPHGIPHQLLPPMARPRPLVVSEDGTAEPLPVRTPPESNGSLPPGIAAKAAMENENEKSKKFFCGRGGPCVAWVILSVVCLGILLAVMLRFIL